jgi:hypothetical protein
MAAGKGGKRAEATTTCLSKNQGNASNHLDGEALKSVKPGFKKGANQAFPIQ